jgi:hypothetical protein
MSPSPIRPSNANDPVEPISYFELQRRRDGLPEPGEEKPAPVMPALPTSSPWHHDPCGDEPSVDRSDDGDTMNVEIDQLNR